MNERINRLEVQCWEPTQYGPAWFNSTKFAELIVEECLYIVEGEDDGSADTKSVRLAMIRMKQHFGVEE